MPHIICLVKQVPDPETPASQFKVDEAAKKVIPAPGVQPTPSQFDTIGVEAAMRIKEAAPGTTVTIMSLGPEASRDAIKRSLAMGADEAVHISDPAVNDADHWVTAEVLAAAIQKIAPYDLIIAGRQATDWDMGVDGLTLGEILDLPVVTIAKEIQLNGGTVTVERVLLDGFETVESPVPAIITVSNELGEPRYPALMQIMQAAKREVKAWTLADLGIAAPASRVNLEALFVPDTSVETEVIEGDTPQEKAQKLAQRLREAKLI